MNFPGESVGGLLHFGDVVEVGYPDNNTGGIVWYEPRIVQNVEGPALYLGEPFECMGHIALAGGSTENGFIRLIPDDDPWTAEEMAKASIIRVFGSYEEMDNPLRAEIAEEAYREYLAATEEYRRSSPWPYEKLVL